MPARLKRGGIKRECRCPRARHQHGTHTAYRVDQCRCDDCRRAAREYEAGRRKRVAFGRSNLVDAAPVRAHLDSLRAQGMGVKRIAAAAGISYKCLGEIVWGRPGVPPNARMKRATAAALLAVELDVADGLQIDGTGTARRLRALVAIGYGGPYLSERLGMLRSGYTSLLRPGGKVHVATARKVAALYDELWDKPPPPSYARSRALTAARKGGYAVPMAWDDDTIDDPRARPRGMTYQRDEVA